MRITDLAFGGPAPALTLEHSFNMDDTRGGMLGIGWSFSLGDTITADPDGTLVLRRGSGRTDRFAAADGSAALFPVTSTTDSLSRAADGTYTLRAAASNSTRTFSSDGRLLSIQDGASVRVALDYDSNGHLSAAHYRGKKIEFATDTTGRIVLIKDTAGRMVSFAYTAEGRLLGQTNADGLIVLYEYDDAGNLTSVVWNGGKTVIAYNGDTDFPAVASVTTPDGAVRQYDSPRTPEEIRVTDGNGDATWYTSSAFGLLLSVADAAGNTTTYSYDAAGNRVQAVNPAGEATSFTYDSSNRLTGITDDANNHWSATYATGGAVRITDPNKNLWTLTYDSNGNLASVTDPRTFTALATRNAAGQILSLGDQKGNKSTYQYSADGLMTGFTDALGNKWTYDYDGAARPSAKTDPTGVTLKATYTTGNRIASLTAGDTTTAFDYSGIHRDSLNRLLYYDDSNGARLVYLYDKDSQLSGIIGWGNSDRPFYEVAYEYDHLHRLSRVYLGGSIALYALYRYDAAGRPISVSVSGGPVTIYQYDRAHNLRATVSTGPDGTPVAGYRYTVDPNGNRTAVSALEPNTTNVPSKSYVYGFDAANRPVSRDDGTSYHYDTRGNLTSIEGASNTQLAYDAFGRLQSLAGDATGSYGYDATGLRTVRNGRRLLYDLSGDRPRAVADYVPNGTAFSQRLYFYGLGLLYGGNGTYFYHFDGDGNTVALSNPTAGVVNTYRYDAQGRMVAAKESVENMFRAHGESGWTDDGNGLLFTGSEFQFSELRLTLPATADASPPVPGFLPQLTGMGACFLEGVANCLASTGGRTR